MTDQDNSYRPRSPDFSSFPSAFPPTTAYSPATATYPAAYPLTSPLAHRASYDASPFFTPQHQRPGSISSRPSQQYIPPVPQTDYFGDYQQYQYPQPPQLPHQQQHQQYVDPDMARRSTRVAARAMDAATASAPAAVSPTSGAPPSLPQPAPPQPAPPPPSEPVAVPAKPSPAAGIEVRTKFPVARIKRIMQADDDVGKVAQVTPIAVSKALELFMISLVTKAAKEAKDRNSKRVTATHLKQAVVKDEVLDFLADIIAKVPDQPAASSGRKQHDDDALGSDDAQGHGHGHGHGQGRRKRGSGAAGAGGGGGRGRRAKDESD